MVELKEKKKKENYHKPEQISTIPTFEKRFLKYNFGPAMSMQRKL